MVEQHSRLGNFHRRRARLRRRAVHMRIAEQLGIAVRRRAAARRQAEQMLAALAKAVKPTCAALVTMNEAFVAAGRALQPIFDAAANALRPLATRQVFRPDDALQSGGPE